MTLMGAWFQNQLIQHPINSYINHQSNAIAPHTVLSTHPELILREENSPDFSHTAVLALQLLCDHLLGSLYAPGYIFTLGYSRSQFTALVMVLTTVRANKHLVAEIKKSEKLEGKLHQLQLQQSFWLSMDHFTL